MAQSKRFLDFCRRIAELSDILPPIRPLGDYSTTEYDRVSAYRVLTHAEFEACIEDLVRDLIQRAESPWDKPRRAAPLTMALINAALNSHHSRINGNNGIKEKDLKQLLGPLGVDVTTLNQKWVGDMDSFGSDRGRTVHSSSYRTHQPPDRVTEFTKVQSLMSGLAILDERLKTLRIRR